VPLGRPPNVELHVAGLEVCSSKHWPIPSDMQLRCCVCKARGVTQNMFVKWDCVLKIHVLKITTKGNSSNNIFVRPA